MQELVAAQSGTRWTDEGADLHVCSGGYSDRLWDLTWMCRDILSCSQVSCFCCNSMLDHKRSDRLCGEQFASFSGRFRWLETRQDTKQDPLPGTTRGHKLVLQRDNHTNVLFFFRHLCSCPPGGQTEGQVTEKLLKTTIDVKLKTTRRKTTFPSSDKPTFDSDKKS